MRKIRYKKPTDTLTKMFAPDTSSSKSVIKSEEYEGKYEVVSGERRLRASKIAGLEKVPCIILESAAQKDEIALIENVQRADLHPVELARGLKKLMDTYGWGANGN